MPRRGTADAFALPLDGVRTALPVIFAYIPLGFAAGVVAARAGLSPAESGLLSLLVFAGVAQFIFADMLGGTAVALVVTIFFVNLRHFLYSTALMFKLKSLPTLKRTAVGAQLTDEGFALISMLYKPQESTATAAGGLLAFNVSTYLAWFSGNVAGAIVGAQQQVEGWGADYLLIAMFAGLLMLKITAAARKHAAVVVLVIAAVLSVGLELLYSHSFNIIIASVLAAAVGAYCFGGGSGGEGEQLLPAEESEKEAEAKP